MSQLDWRKRRIAGTCAPQQRWATTLFAISAFGTALAVLLLVFDNWIDALTVYLISGLTLAILLSRIAGQRAGLHVPNLVSGNILVSSNIYGPGELQSGSLRKQASRSWLDRFDRTPRVGGAVSPSALRKAASAD